jgi:hypothetical protein
VIVSGIGFGANETIRIDFGSTQGITTTVSDAAGAFDATFIVDNQSEGVKTINATGLTTGEFATSTFNYVITPINLSISINSGAIYTISRAVTLTLHADEADQCRYSNNGSVWTAWENYATTRAWNLTTGDGWKTVYYQCEDSKGKLSDIVSDTVILDTTAPSAPVLLRPANGTRMNDQTPTFEWAKVENDSSGIDSYIISINGTNYTVYTTSYTPATLNEGTYPWKVKAVDNAGNEGVWSVEWTVIIDTTAPTLVVIGPTGSSNTGSVTLMVNTSESATCKYSEYNVSYDNMGSVMTHIGNNQHAAPLYGLIDGTYTFYFSCKDLAGNEGTIAKTTFTIDRTAPTVLDAEPEFGAYFTSVQDLKITVDENATCRWANHTGSMANMPVSNEFTVVANVEKTITEGTPNATMREGDNKFFIICNDTLGNEMDDPIIINFLIDTVAPSAPSLIIPANDTKTNDQTPLFVWADAQDDTSGISYYNITITGPTAISATTTESNYIPTVTLNEGTYTWKVKAIDEAGNVGAWSLIYTFTIDTTAPNATMNALPTYSAKTFALTWTGTDTGVGIDYYEVQYRKDGGAWTQIVRTWNETYAPFVGDDGSTYEFEVRAVDKAGNVEIFANNAEATTIIDESPPVIIFSAPNGTINVTTPTLVVRTNENATCEYNTTQFEYGSGNAFTTTGGTYHNVTLTELDDGHYMYYVKCRDTTRNNTMKTSEEIYFRLLRTCEYGLNLENLWTSHVDLPPVITRLTANPDGSYNISDVMESIWDNLLAVWWYNETNGKWLRYYNPATFTGGDWNATRVGWQLQGKWIDTMTNLHGEQYWVHIQRVPDKICF